MKNITQEQFNNLNKFFHIDCNESSIQLIKLVYNNALPNNIKPLFKLSNKIIISIADIPQDGKISIPDVLDELSKRYKLQLWKNLDDTTVTHLIHFPIL